MTNVTLTINQQEVYNEVYAKTNYVSAKMVDEEGNEGTSIDRISTIDEDKPELDMFWDECREYLVEQFQTMLVEEGMREPNEGEETLNYSFTVGVQDGFNQALLPTAQIGLFNYFVYGILGRWFMYTNKDEAAAYLTMSEDRLGGVKSKLTKRIFTRKMNPFA